MNWVLYMPPRPYPKGSCPQTVSAELVGVETGRGVEGGIRYFSKVHKRSCKREKRLGLEHGLLAL